MIDNSVEYILCAAIYLQDGKIYPHQPKNIEDGFIVTGMRHHNCLTVYSYIFGGSKNVPCIQGFLTSKNRFVDRVEAVQIALQSGQLGKSKKELFSEDIY